jgi:hypothetical protein
MGQSDYAPGSDAPEDLTFIMPPFQGDVPHYDGLVMCHTKTIPGSMK